MTRGTKILITFLIIVIAALSTSSGYLFAKNANLVKQAGTGLETSADKNSATVTTDTSAATTVTPTPVVSVSTSPTVTPTPKPTTSISTTGEKYTVKSGDTMYSIALQFKVNWLDLAKANGLDETTANKIKIGQVLVIPAK